MRITYSQLASKVYLENTDSDHHSYYHVLEWIVKGCSDKRQVIIVVHKYSALSANDILLTSTTLQLCTQHTFAFPSTWLISNPTQIHTMTDSKQIYKPCK